MDTDNQRLFRLVVSNAAEAVAMIQKKFGTGASVQSVKQYKPKGMTKLWAAPKLEIIVSVPRNPEAQKPFQIKETQENEGAKNAVSSEPAMPDVEEVTKSSSSSKELETRPEKTVDPKPSQSLNDGGMRLSIEQILLQSDFDSSIVERLKSSPHWATISQKNPKQALTEIVSMLKTEFAAAQNGELTTRVAFMGTCGVGKSTILRKYVANRVFIKGKKVQILKLDDDDPNPDDMLNIFCQILGTELVRDPADLVIDRDTEIYVDIPGVSLHRPELIRQFRGILDELKIDSRVLVMNSMYDIRALNNAYEVARHMRASHQVFTHLDELENWAKLWRFVLKGSLPLIFLNIGDEASISPKEEFLPLLISKTFPNILLN
jgi:flagellar biosynthesis protein FlhF